MTTSSKNLWRELSNILSSEEWISLQDIYAKMAARFTFDSDDLRPEVGQAKQRAWQRNIRNVLGQYERKGIVERASNGAHYRISEKRTAWRLAEINSIVGDYMTMLVLELKGIKYSKTEHRRQILPRLQDRSEQSIEFKYCNVSAVMADMGLPYIDGYKPRSHYQEALKDVVIAQLQDKPEIEDTLREAALSQPREIARVTSAVAFAPIPISVIPPENKRSRRGRIIDYTAVEAKNVALGKAGEAWVMEIERQRLARNGRPDLSKKIEWISQTKGDGLGYDIASYEKDGAPIFIEVKTTKGGPEIPFLITSTELDCSEELGAAYRLYRVFRFNTAPQLYVIKGVLSTQLDLTPKMLLARPRKG